jgi:hypothetical protein
VHLAQQLLAGLRRGGMELVHEGRVEQLVGELAGLIGVQPDRAHHHRAACLRECLMGGPQHLGGTLRAADHRDPPGPFRVEFTDPCRELGAVDHSLAGNRGERFRDVRVPAGRDDQVPADHSAAVGHFHDPLADPVVDTERPHRNAAAAVLDPDVRQ